MVIADLRDAQIACILEYKLTLMLVQNSNVQKRIQKIRNVEASRYVDVGRVLSESTENILGGRRNPARRIVRLRKSR